jgi:hypothetical protein
MKLLLIRILLLLHFSYYLDGCIPTSANLTEVFPRFILSCKANARVKPAKMGHGPDSSKVFVLFHVLFVLCRSVYFVLCCSMYCFLCRSVYFVLCCSMYCLFCVVLCILFCVVLCIVCFVSFCVFCFVLFYVLFVLCCSMYCLFCVVLCTVCV